MMNPNEYTYEFCLLVQENGRAVPARHFTVKCDSSEDPELLAGEKGRRLCKRNGWTYADVHCWGMA